jgi:hypothetical protein
MKGEADVLTGCARTLATWRRRPLRDRQCFQAERDKAGGKDERESPLWTKEGSVPLRPLDDAIDVALLTGNESRDL